MKSESPYQMMPRLEFGLFTLACCEAAILVAVACSAGRCLSEMRVPQSGLWLEGIGFLLFVNHFGLLAPLRLLAIARKRSQRIISDSIPHLLRSARSEKAEGIAIYAVHVPPALAACMGLGLALSDKHDILILIGCPLVIVFCRLVLIRLSAEPYCSFDPGVHRPESISVRVVVWCADLPIVAVAILMGAASGHFLWYIAASLMLSYSLAIRIGSWPARKGPIGYLAVLGATAITSLLVWPLLHICPGAATSLPRWLLLGISFAGGIAVLFRRTISPHISAWKRLLPGLIVVVGVIVALLPPPTGPETGFSVWGRFASPAQVWFLVVVFWLLLTFYSTIMVVAEEWGWFVTDDGETIAGPDTNGCLVAGKRERDEGGRTGR